MSAEGRASSRLERRHAPSLRNWERGGRDRLPRDFALDCGWGRLIFAHTFASNKKLAATLADEGPVPADQVRVAPGIYQGPIPPSAAELDPMTNAKRGGAMKMIYLDPPRMDLARTLSVSKAVEGLKVATSRWIKAKGDAYAAFAWQSGYAAFAVSVSNIDAVRGYIARQREHHHQLSFQDECRALFRRHGVPFDERYVWD